MSRFEPVLPPATIGILGGGQLGRMLAMAARAMGYRVWALDPDPECPAGAVVDRLVVGAYDDVPAALELAGGSDVVTYELEHVSAALVAAVADRVPVRPGLAALAATQDRIAERRFVEGQGVAVAPWRAVRDPGELGVAADVLGLPLRVKVPLGGYDGRSQVRIGSPREIGGAWDALGRVAGEALLAERELSFAMELSVIAARDAEGDLAAFPLSRNVHDAGILVESVAPAPVGRAVAAAAEGIVWTLAEALDLAGTLTAELFLLDDGSLVVNELAPRVHNSGHWTLDGAATSQFEQHVRAMCGLPLGSVAPSGATAMVNLLGAGGRRPARLLGVEAGLADSAAHLYLYDKRVVFERRKMGHVTVVGDSIEDALLRARRAAAALWWTDGDSGPEEPAAAASSVGR